MHDRAPTCCLGRPMTSWPARRAVGAGSSSSFQAGICTSWLTLMVSPGRCWRSPTRWGSPRPNRRPGGPCRPCMAAPSRMDQRGHHGSWAAAESGPIPPGPRWGRAPPDDHEQQRRATVSRPCRSATVSERSPRSPDHPDCLSHGGSHGGLLCSGRSRLPGVRARGTSSLRGETVVLARFRSSVMWLPPIHVQPSSGVPTSLLRPRTRS
jgi:hypothetical protein